MKNGQCPKCECSDVHIVDGNRFEPTIPLGGLSSGAFINAYVCVKCGYIEMYVEDQEDLAKIAARWQRVAMN